VDGGEDLLIGAHSLQSPAFLLACCDPQSPSETCTDPGLWVLRSVPDDDWIEQCQM
jgi:hypothetical protein